MENGKNYFLKITAVISIVIGTLAIYFMLVFWPAPKASVNVINQSNKSLESVTGAKIGGDFCLIDTDNNEFTSEKLKGKPYLVYFGFTFCPDVCPVTLEKISKVMKILDTYHIDISAVFITVDPKRDDYLALKSYMTNFNPANSGSKIIALTGAKDQIKDVIEKFKIYAVISPLSDSKSDDYLIDHTTFVYLMDKNGKYVKHFTLNDSVKDIVEYIRVNMKSGQHIG